MTQDEIDKLEVDLTYKDDWATVTRYLVVKLLAEYKALQRRVEWTKERPTEPGWYWWRTNPRDTEVVEFIIRHDQLVCNSYPYELDPIEAFTHETMEWAGPIEPPHEARG